MQNDRAKSKNSKSEIRNSKQFQMPKIPMTKTVLSFEFRAWDLFRIWCLEIRISPPLPLGKGKGIQVIGLTNRGEKSDKILL
jgi:hypothetical protein